MKFSKLFLFGLALNASATLLLAGTTAVSTNAVLARGKNFEVTRPQLDEAWAIYASKMSRGGQLPDEPRSSVEAKLLDHIVETEILLQKATPDEQKHALSDVERMLVASRQHFQTENDFKDWLATMGMTPEIYRRRMIEQRTSELVIDREVAPSVKVTDEEVKNYYEQNLPAFDKPEQVRGRQIFFSTVDPASEKPLSDEQKKAKETLAKQVKARIDKGEDFFKLYKEFSEEPWAKDEKANDDLLYVKGQMPPEFDAAAFSLKTNQVSEVVTTKVGYHIIRISAHEPASRLSLSEVAPRLREFLMNEEIKKKMPAYLEKIKKEAGVEILVSGVLPTVQQESVSAK